ncbi:hypothetical protein [Caulobacter sp. UNC279MFTsu5.1]|uniref:hypothetical protein n=1 Tax=Caulobacter sp. UNC279MFTsu5.1 TaxID=1502775 RepID=UPI0008E63488|nr:hypothetical protein [Caulobacter sp. UNC279MFTsu5.1]SFJ62728.1 hypothetical protein SAMN02799626_02221 [Caulobacter sp. UNC279MFTsu5.1]
MRLFGAALCAAFLSLAPAAHASDAQAGYITNIIPFGDGGVILFDHDGSRSPRPACATLPQRWAFNASGAGGQARLSALLTAFAAHKRIEISGLATCSQWGDTETLSYFVIKD